MLQAVTYVTALTQALRASGLDTEAARALVREIADEPSDTRVLENLQHLVSYAGRPDCGKGPKFICDSPSGDACGVPPPGNGGGQQPNQPGAPADPTLSDKLGACWQKFREYACSPMGRVWLLALGQAAVNNAKRLPPGSKGQTLLLSVAAAVAMMLRRCARGEQLESKDAMALCRINRTVQAAAPAADMRGAAAIELIKPILSNTEWTKMLDSCCQFVRQTDDDGDMPEWWVKEGTIVDIEKFGKDIAT